MNTAMWHYLVDDQVQGPIPQEEMAALAQAGRIGPETMVWRPGFADWVEARACELESLFPAEMPPPVPQTAPPPPPMPGTAPPPPLTAGVPTGAAPARPPELMPLGPRALRFRWAAFGFLAMCVVSIGSLVLDLRFINDAFSGVYETEAEIMAAARAVESRGYAVTVFTVISFLVSALCLLMWTHRASRNLHEIDADGMTISPEWAVGWYFIPIAFLWKPFQAMRQIARASQDPQAPHRAVGAGPLGWWWFFWLAPVPVRAASRAYESMPDSMLTQASLTMMIQLGFVEVALDMLSCLLLMMIVKTATAAQDTRILPQWGAGEPPSSGRP